MAYNVENLFDMVDNGNEYSIYKPFKHNWNYETLSKKLNNITSVIGAANPDILVLCEIENLNAGRMLQTKLKKSNLKYNYIAAGDDPGFAVTCQVILSRFPIKFRHTHKIPSKGLLNARNILEVDIEIGGQILKIFAVHWLSKRHSESFRKIEAEILTKRIKELEPGTDYIIVGDFNSNYNEAETFYTEGLDDTKQHTAINHGLKTVVSSPFQFIHYVTEKYLRENPQKFYHYDLWLELPEYKRYSYKYKGQYCTLDHILVSASLYDSKGISYIDNSFTVFSWDGRLLFDGVPLRWSILYGNNGRYHSGVGYSDHLPIIASFSTKPFSSNVVEITKPISQKKKALRPKNVISGFETGVEGWISLKKQIHVFRDTLNPKQGRYCLKIEGKTKQSASVAKLCLPLYYYSIKNKGFLKLALRGFGFFNFRIRIDNSNWLYYTDHFFNKKINNNKYSYQRYQEWSTIVLPLPELSIDSKSIEIEIRSAAKKEICLWLDNIQLYEKL